jgi:hypothetical protein
MDIYELIASSLTEYDKTSSFIQTLGSDYQFELIEPSLKYDKHKIIFRHNKTNEELFTSAYEILGFFYGKHNIWVWAWSHLTLNYSQKYLSQELLQYALKLDDAAQLKNIFITGRGIVRSKTEIDIYLALSANITKQPYIYPDIKEYEDHYFVTYYILLETDKIKKIEII